MGGVVVRSLPIFTYENDATAAQAVSDDLALRKQTTFRGGSESSSAVSGLKKQSITYHVGDSGEEKANFSQYYKEAIGAEVVRSTTIFTYENDATAAQAVKIGLALCRERTYISGSEFSLKEKGLKKQSITYFVGDSGEEKANLSKNYKGAIGAE